jgi:hypothetical protein
MVQALPHLHRVSHPSAQPMLLPPPVTHLSQAPAGRTQQQQLLQLQLPRAQWPGRPAAAGTASAATPRQSAGQRSGSGRCTLATLQR